jgi:hypothetical protein
MQTASVISLIWQHILTSEGHFPASSTTYIKGRTNKTVQCHIFYPSAKPDLQSGLATVSIKR